MERSRFLQDARSETHTMAMADAFGFNGKKLSSQRSGTFLWRLVRKQWVKVCVTVRTVLMNKKDINTDHWLAQHCTLDKTDLKHNMQRKKQRDSCLIPYVVVSSSFPYQEMPNEMRAVLEAIWAGELEVLRSTSCGLIYFR